MSTKRWSENDELFVSELKGGREFEVLVAALLNRRGIPATVPPLKVRGSIREAPGYADQADVLIDGVGKLEVKSRRLAFTGPRDVPENRMPFMVTTEQSWRDCKEKPIAVVVVSREVATLDGDGDGVLTIPAKTAPAWDVIERFDRTRQITERFLAADRSCLRTFDALVAHLKNAIAAKEAEPAPVSTLQPREVGDERFSGPCAHLYPYVAKDYPKKLGRLENAVRVYHNGRWHLATLLRAFSTPKGCQAVLMGEPEEIIVGYRKDNTPIYGGPRSRDFDWTEVRPEGSRQASGG